jgi:circadian clock protein KaiA
MLVMERGALDDSQTDDLTKNSSAIRHPQISLCIYLSSAALKKGVMANMQRERYVMAKMKSMTDLVQYIIEEHHQVDCLVVEQDEEFIFLVEQLQQQYIFLPIVVINPKSTSETPTVDPDSTSNFIYHSYEVDINVDQLDQINTCIDQAIRQFVTHAVTTRLNDASSQPDTPTELTRFIERQQKRLAEKLHERLGYLGVYYKRNPRNFLRNLSVTDRQELLEQLKSKYRQIVLNYFSKDPDLNKKIDEYVNIAFFADLPISRVVEIHMELMDQLSKQLKLEGRSEEMLLDYRLTLIDIMAHLCEMYRRSIPKES